MSYIYLLTFINVGGNVTGNGVRIGMDFLDNNIVVDLLLTCGQVKCLKTTIKQVITVYILKKKTIAC